MAKQYQYRDGDRWGDLVPSLMSNIETTTSGRLVYDAVRASRSVVWGPGEWRVKPGLIPGFDEEECGVWYIHGSAVDSWVCYDPVAQKFIEVFNDGGFYIHPDLETTLRKNKPFTFIAVEKIGDKQ